MNKEYKQKVESNVKDYLEKHNLGELVSCRPASNYPADYYLFHVIAKKNDEYRCWTCWNETTQSLNCGHYGLASYDEALTISLDHFHSICKY